MWLNPKLKAQGGSRGRLSVQHGPVVNGQVLVLCRENHATAALILLHHLSNKMIREAQRRAFPRVFMHLAFSG
jgi:hypothetical protein